MTALLAATLAAAGIHMLWLGPERGRSDLGVDRPRAERARSVSSAARRWLAQAGLDEVQPLEFAAVALTLAVIGGGFGLALFGGAVPALLAGAFAGSLPLRVHRNRRRLRRDRAQEAWPRIIEEIRILTGSVGRSIPQALFEAGQRAPDELRGAFGAAHREWLMTTDFARTVRVLKERLADPTADAACETLLVAHEVGGADLDQRLEALADDRMTDLQGRRDARAQQAGVRFARRFVLIVPIGMALAGTSVGEGRSAYREPLGQAVVVAGMFLVLACWIWAGRMMQVPDEDRVFDS